MGSELEVMTALTFSRNISAAAAPVDVAASISQQSPNCKLKPANRDVRISRVPHTDFIYYPH